MGAWGAGNFDNDTALDWIDELAFEDDPVSVVLAVIQECTAMEPDDYLDAGNACEVLVAAELVAAACGKPPQEAPDDVLNWVNEHGDKQEVKQAACGALEAVERVASSSELKDLWEEDGASSPSAQEWGAVLTDLKTRLAQCVKDDT